MSKNIDFIKNDPRQDEIKICSDCGQHKKRKHFSISNVKPKGTIVRRPYCKKCDNIRQTKKRRDNGINSRRIPIKNIDNIVYYECDVCKIFKPKEAFPKDNYKHNTIGISRPCKDCRKHCNKVKREAIVSDFLTLSQEEEHDKHKGSIHQLKQHILNLAKTRSKLNGIEFSITLEDFDLPSICPILHIPIIPGIGKQSAFSPSLDRIDCTKGYIKGNIAVISYRANAMKNDASLAELKTFSDNILSYMKMKR